LYLGGGSDGKRNQVNPISQPFALWRKKIGWILHIKMICISLLLQETLDF
jgi:hypothetical protein